MRSRPLQLALFMAVFAPAAELPALQQAVAPRDTGVHHSPALTFLLSAQMMARYAILPEDIPSLWGPGRLLSESQRLGLSAEQLRALEALDSRIEAAFFSAMGSLVAPDSILLARLWSDAIIDATELAQAGLVQAERGNRALMAFARIREEILALLAPAQRAEFLRLEAAENGAWRGTEVRSAADAAEMLARLAEAGHIPHPLLVARLRATELDLSPAELRRLEALHTELVAALDALRAPIMIETRTQIMSPADLQATLEAEGRGSQHVVAFAAALLRLRDATYEAIAGERAAALALMQAEMAARPFRRQEAPPRECRTGGMGGGGMLEGGRPDLHHGFGLTFRGDVAEIDILVIGRGDGGRLRNTVRPAVQEGLRGAGFSMGRWILAHDPEGARLWLHETPIDLGDANVVILDLDDVPDGDVPRVAALLRVEPLLPTGGCAGKDIFVLLRDFVFGHPDLRHFLDR